MNNSSLIMRSNGVSEAVYVGDTELDMISAGQAGIPFIHAAYGFGGADAPDGVIRDIRELPELLKKHE